MLVNGRGKYGKRPSPGYGPKAGAGQPNTQHLGRHIAIMKHCLRCSFKLKLNFLSDNNLRKTARPIICVMLNRNPRAMGQKGQRTASPLPTPYIYMASPPRFQKKRITLTWNASLSSRIP
jgi:hypothetical protein